MRRWQDKEMYCGSFYFKYVLYIKKRLQCRRFDVEGIDKAKLMAGLQNENFSDFEDCLQMECAKAYGAQYIVTRNVGDYKSSEIKAIMPKDFLRL